jgi:hypothetical protein
MSSNYVNSNNVNSAINLVAPVWLDKVSKEIIASAKSYASRFGSANRKFWYHVDSTTGSINLHQSNIYCEGPFVEATAWDIEFTVPVGGFKYGDINPLTKEPFPGGMSKRGSYITLENKPEFEGEKVKYIARTYSKYSGQTIKKAGFFSQAIRKNFGENSTISEVGSQNLKLLALFIGKEIAINIGNQCRREFTALGYRVTIDGPHIITSDG